jgi:uncharacterized surface protein with fasciclin (FAS1) repeats
MRNTFFYGKGCWALLLFCCFASCKKTPSLVRNTITPFQALINTDTTFSLFHRLVLQANDAGLISNDSITVLLPTNAAFRAAGYSETIIDSVTTVFADNLLRYQFISSRIIPSGPSYTGYTTLQGSLVYGMTDSTHTRWFNGTPVIGDSSFIGNVLIYKLSAPLPAPADSLDILLDADSTLTFMAEVLQRTNLDSVLFSGNLTLLAPTNTAFMNAGYDSVGAIDAADSSTLVQLVKYHTLTADWFTNTLMGVTTVATLQGGSLTVGNQNGVLQFSGTGNGTPANLLSGNRLAGSTLIVHRIDEVLSP